MNILLNNIDQFLPANNRSVKYVDILVGRMWSGAHIRSEAHNGEGVPKCGDLKKLTVPLSRQKHGS